jgi:hypothetical protein
LVKGDFYEMTAYIISASGKRFIFNNSTRVLNGAEETENINFVAYRKIDDKLCRKKKAGKTLMFCQPFSSKF